jgi:hypothetical protein
MLMPWHRADHAPQARPVASTPHLVWAAGHFLTFIAGLRFLIGTFLFSSAALGRWYSVAYLGAVVSYGVVVYKSFGVSCTAQRAEVEGR